MERTLKELLEGVDVESVTGTLKRPIVSLVTDSRRVTPRCLFFALPGERTHGGHFIEEAIDRGASAVVTEEVRRPHAGVTFVRVPDPRAVMARVARSFYGAPDRAMRLFGVTGSYGKTSTVHLLQHFLRVAGRRAGMTGSIVYELGSRTVPSSRTTPESVDLVAMISEMKDAGYADAVVEIDASGVRRHSVSGLEFAVAVFLNAASGEEAGADRRAFEDWVGGRTGVPPKQAVVDAGDPAGRRILAALPKEVTPVPFGTGTGAVVRALRIETRRTGTEMVVGWPEGEAGFRLPLVGRPHARNFLAAAAAAYAGGLNPADLARALASFPGVPGRVERIDEGQPFAVFVDQAHTETPLCGTLDALRETGYERVLAVFGCGGRGERSRRGPMVEAVQRHADRAWATADNPRGEPLEQILDDMRRGVRDPASIAFVEDRREAISRAFEAARPGDCVLIAGKGDELFQDMGNTLLPFDDRRVARELLTTQRLKGL